MRTKKVIVEEYNCNWIYEFEKLKAYFQKILNNLIMSIEHVGSTSVYGLAAKPIIDIDVVIKDYNNFNNIKSRLKKYGYYYEGELGIKDRHAFRYDENRNKFMAHHLYVCPENSDELKKHIAFRDYLRLHKDDMKKYSEIKLKGANIYPDNIEGYMAYKSSFIDNLYKKIK